MPNNKLSHFVYEPHNHKQCIKTALKQAQAVCSAHSVKLTPMREKVLGIIWQSHKPLGAYDILALLSEPPGKIIAPPTVYRALEFLISQGLIHKIESLNAFIGCSSPDDKHLSQFLLCRQCGIALEMASGSVAAAIQDNAAHYGFHIDNETIEISGLCHPCQNQPDPNYKDVPES
jgi:Fur family zinc uptake transcriptional regulator